MTKYSLHNGELRTRITFQQPTVTKDAGGAQVESGWANVTSNPTVWARVTYDHGQELATSEAKKAVQRATVSVRYRNDVLTTWRVLIDGEPYMIISPPENVQRQNRWLEFRIEQAKGSV